MIRKKYFDYIEEKLHTLSRRIESRGKLNLLDIHGFSEDFYAQFFSLLYGYDLVNLNEKQSNVAAIDLVDKHNKIIIQVSATSTKQKIESSLSKAILKDYSDYNFKFISISKDSSALRSKKYKNPHNINFAPDNDIYDIASILKSIKNMDLDGLDAVYLFIKKELGSNVDRVQLDSNLAVMINFLAKENLDKIDNTISVNSFEIDTKITFNDLERKRDIIEEYFVYHTKVDKIYSEFDSMRLSKTLVLNFIGYVPFPISSFNT
ncbi:ABC-three component system protein [Methanolobus sp. WCC5]|uniref:ABC-three component system protein n=1 Tax=Methanolobus sp. WCC5 TaxID=3125785 RepID=UPI00324D0561